MRSDWAMRRLQFRTLYRVFLLRVVDLELLSADGDPTKLIGQFATIFVTISFFFTLPALLMLMGSGSLGMTAGWTPEHFFIETAMTTAGLVAVLNWDAAFPDRRDVLVLSPLPVRKSTLFVAKVAALFAAPALAVIALNIFSGVVWPFLFRSGNGGFFGVLRVWPAYWISTFAARLQPWLLRRINAYLRGFPPIGSWLCLTNSMARCIPRWFRWQGERGSA